MSEQSEYERFTPSAWNFIKGVNLNEDEQDRLRLMIETKTETITKEEIQAMLYAVVRW